MALSRPSCPGNEDGRFQLEGNTLFYLPNELAEPRTFVLLVEVRGGPSAPRRSTTVALVVHVTPRSTPVPPSTTTLHTVSRACWPDRAPKSIRPPGCRMPLTSPPPQTLQKEPLVVVRAEAVWNPPAWFVAVLTVSGALLLAALGCMARTLLCR